MTKDKIYKIKKSDLEVLAYYISQLKCRCNCTFEESVKEPGMCDWTPIENWFADIDENSEFDDIYFSEIGGINPIRRKISNQELADLPTNWENAKLDTSKYNTTVINAWEVDYNTYNNHRYNGQLCRNYKNKYYVA